MAEDAKGLMGGGVGGGQNLIHSLNHIYFRLNITIMETNQEFEYRHRLLQNLLNDQPRLHNAQK